MNRNVFDEFAGGKVFRRGKAASVAEAPWRPHKDFRGVYLKDVVTGDAAGGSFTAHLVRIDPECAIGMHSHPASIELHEVIAGGGTCVTPDGETAYAPGCVNVLERGERHEVRAGAEGLKLFAKFIAVPG